MLSEEEAATLRPTILSLVVIKILANEAAMTKTVLLGEYGGDSGGEFECGTIYMLAHQIKHKALVKIMNVKLPGNEVPFQHRDWGSGKLALGDAMDRAIDSNSNTRQIHNHILSVILFLSLLLHLLEF